jgi:hypothetical protein
LSILALLAPAWAATAAEPLREVVHPKAEYPAFRCLVPSDWTSQVDAFGNLQLANPDHTANFSLNFANSTNAREALDPLAKLLLASAVHPPWDGHEPAEISGFHGAQYTAHVRHSNGVEVHAEVTLVPVGDHQVAACSMLLSTRIKPADEAIARLVFAAVRIVAPPPSDQTYK